MAEAEVRHDSLEDETEVWNVTVKPIRIPNHQVIMGKSSTKVRGWGIWKSDDVIKAWLQTGALTEEDPGAEPPLVRTAEADNTSFPAAPNVFSGRVEPPRKKKPVEKAAEPQKVRARPSPGPGPGPGAQ